MVVHLRWKVVRLWFAGPPDQRCLLVGVVYVKRQRAKVVEELAVHRPTGVALPQPLADQRGAEVTDEFVEGDLLLIWSHDKAQALIRSGERSVVRVCSGR